MSGCQSVEAQLRWVLPFEAAPSELRPLRRAAAKQLSRWGLSGDAENAVLVITELATNVVKHVGESVSAALILENMGERLRLEVHDRSRAVPALKPVHSGDECGRGLHLVAALAVDWGTILTAAGKAVWCEIQLDAERTCRRLDRAAEVLERYQGSAVRMEGRGREVALQESAVELIADLLHWTTARGQDPDDILDRAQMHYEADASAA
ncbi:ATP-binding protein [Streptomyces sp. NPDC090075]|uniref:ATP-binding protein n=1 Tax=Streptomyces sp. NPDC090075 TaxID=3365937 RepID=UPI00380B9E66